MPFSSQSILKINLAALTRNWQKFDNLGAHTTSAVIKANAYGIGANECSKALQNAGCKDFFVANLIEAIEARKFISANCKIYVLNGFFDKQEDLFYEFDLIPVLNSIEQFEIFTSKLPNQPYAIHFDTGMNRQGIRFDDFDNINKIINAINQPLLIISHLACASNIDASLNEIQNIRFKEIQKYFPNSKFSLSASAGALIGNEYLYDLIRPGIGLYGGNPIVNKPNIFEPVVEIHAPLIQIREVKTGESIGYGATYIASKNMKIGIIPIGYADGFIRAAQNGGKAYLNNNETQILGRISMDLIAINLENIDNVHNGDFVELLGKNISIDNQANCANTISYEFLTRLGTRFNRIYHYD